MKTWIFWTHSWRPPCTNSMLRILSLSLLVDMLYDALMICYQSFRLTDRLFEYHQWPQWSEKHWLPAIPWTWLGMGFKECHNQSSVLRKQVKNSRQCRINLLFVSGDIKKTHKKCRPHNLVNDAKNWVEWGYQNQHWSEHNNTTTRPAHELKDELSKLQTTILSSGTCSLQKNK